MNNFRDIDRSFSALSDYYRNGNIGDYRDPETSPLTIKFVQDQSNSINNSSKGFFKYFFAVLS